jgi:hypothetical protein
VNRGFPILVDGDEREPRLFEGVGIVFSPSDHHGIWAMQREGISGKGILYPNMRLRFWNGSRKKRR